MALKARFRTTICRTVFCFPFRTCRIWSHIQLHGKSYFGINFWWFCGPMLKSLVPEYEYQAYIDLIVVKPTLSWMHSTGGNLLTVNCFVATFWWPEQFPQLYSFIPSFSVLVNRSRHSCSVCMAPSPSLFGASSLLLSFFLRSKLKSITGSTAVVTFWHPSQVTSLWSLP